MSHWWTAAVGIAGVVGALLIGLGLVIAAEVGKKLAVDEVSARLSGLPYASFWIAVRAYPESQRETWFAEWADTYQAIIDDTEGKPLTRLWRTHRFCFSLVARSGIVNRFARSWLASERIDFVALLASFFGLVGGGAGNLAYSIASVVGIVGLVVCLVGFAFGRFGRRRSPNSPAGQGVDGS